MQYRNFVVESTTVHYSTEEELNSKGNEINNRNENENEEKKGKH